MVTIPRRHAWWCRWISYLWPYYDVRVVSWRELRWRDLLLVPSPLDVVEMVAHRPGYETMPHQCQFERNLVVCRRCWRLMQPVPS